MPDFWSQRALSVQDIGGAGVVPIGGQINHNVAGGAETIEIRKTDRAKYLVVRCEVGTHRFRPGKLAVQTLSTVTIGTDSILLTAHGYQTGDGPLQVDSTTTLPAGLAADTDYWIVRVDVNNIQFALSLGDAEAGIVVDITGTGTGTHTIGGNDGTGAVGFTPAHPPAADNVAGTGSFPLVPGESILFSGDVITFRATAVGDVLTWYEV